MLLHAQPVLVADVDATVAPLVVVGPPGRIQERFLGMLPPHMDNYGNAPITIRTRTSVTHL